MAQTISIRDKQIITKSFRLMCSGMDNMTVKDHLNWELYYNYFTTSVGDNKYINPIPQFSPATDPRYTRFMTSDEGGMGTQFKKVYEDNFSFLTITAGVAEFTGLLSFITTMFNPVSAIVANKGRSPGWTFYFGQALGTIAFWPMQLFNIGMQFLSFLTDSPRNQFYYVKPAMGAYLSGAQGFFNDILISLGYINPVLPNSGKTQTGEPLYGNSGPVGNIDDQQARLARMFPNAVNSDGTIDLAVLVSKGTRKYRYMIDKLQELDNSQSGTVEDKFDSMQNIMENMKFNQSVLNRGGTTADYRNAEEESVNKYRDSTQYGEGNYPEEASSYTQKNAYDNVYNPDIDISPTSSSLSADGSQTVGSTTPTPPPATPGTGDNAQPPAPASQASGSSAGGNELQSQVDYSGYSSDDSWQSQVKDLVKTAWEGGFDAITWRVEHQGAVTDTFSNSETSSPMASKFNAMVQSANNFKFDMGGGKLGIPGVDSIISSLTEGFQGLAASLTIANIPLAMANNSYINIPDHWESSSASLHKENYRIRFECPYAHPYCQIMNIWVPFALLAPLVMPQNAGGSAYTTPFLVKAFSQSRQIIRTGMISDATFTFGDGPVGWTKDRKPLNLTVDFSIVDLDKLISLPITRSLGVADLTNPAAFMGTILNDSGKYNDWLARLTGIEYLDTVLKWSRLGRRLTMAKVGLDYSLSASNIANTINDSVVTDIGKIFHRQMRR